MMSRLSEKRRAAFVFAFILLLTLICNVTEAFAQQAKGPVIFDVRRSLPLEADEVVTKDFYINVGPESGMKKGVYVSVFRAIPIHDPLANKQQAEINIPVGKLRVIDVQRGITVARLESELGDDERPTVEYEGIMIGDQIDLGTMSSEQPKKPKPKVKKIAVQREEPAAPALNEGSAQAMAVRSAAPVQLVPAQSATATAPAPASEVASELKTSAEVKPDANAPKPAPHQETGEAQAIEAPKKSVSPKSVERDLEQPDTDLHHRSKNVSPRSVAADNLRVADYTDVGF